MPDTRGIWIMTRLRRETHAVLVQLAKHWQQRGDGTSGRTHNPDGDRLSLDAVIAELLRRDQEHRRRSQEWSRRRSERARQKRSRQAYAEMNDVASTSVAASHEASPQCGKPPAPTAAVHTRREGSQTPRDAATDVVGSEIMTSIVDAEVITDARS